MTRLRTLPFWSVHLAAVAGVVWLGWSWTGLGLAVALYYARMFFITAGWHRYFSHRSFHTSRPFQFVLALGGTLCAEKGLLWWVGTHRIHHKYTDQPEDPHSPLQGGFWWSHAGWFLSGKHKHTAWKWVGDLARYPELVWLDRYHAIPVVAFALVLLAAGGVWALVWGFLVSTVLLWHGTFTINSFAHTVGSRRYATDDTSRNNPALALLTLGEGWHNNHHRYQRAVNQGFRWWELDVSYYILWVLARLRLVSELHRAPRQVVFGTAATSGGGGTSTQPV
jgi:stearoyl-CoA desaturase (delta-9 desaturase)